MISEEDKKRIKQIENRTWFSFVFLLCIFISIVCYLFALQILDAKHYKTKAMMQRNGKSFIMRGQILDCNGIKLASEQTSYNIYAHREYFDHTPEELADVLYSLLGLDKKILLQKIKNGPNIILLKKDIDRQTAEQIKKLGLREISLDKKNERVYPQDSLAAHILGFYNPDADTAAGVEYTARKKLAHSEKEIHIEKTPRGDFIYNADTDAVLATTPQKGETITLTINSAIQHVCESELLKAITEKAAARGTVIVMNPKNGEILGYAVYPTYNPNQYKKVEPIVLKNWTLSDVYPPGSTFKVLTVAAGLETGKLTPTSTVLDTGRIKIGGWTIENHDYHTFPNPGNISLVYLLQHSSNVGSIKVAMMMNKYEYYNILSKFGIGKKTGIDLPGESNGILPLPHQWDKSTQATMSYGYGASVTAVQLLSAISAIANNGIRVTPHVIKYSPEEEAEKIKKVQVISSETSKVMRDLLGKATANSENPANLEEYSVAEKTGTSRKPLENQKGYYNNKQYASVVGFFPVSDPKLIIYVVIDSASAGGPVWGSTVAAPVFKEVALQCARILNIPPDKQQKNKK